jgi:hypothetical protein
MTGTDRTDVSWRGDIWAGVLRSKCWTSRLEASREGITLSGPFGMGYELASSDVRRMEPAIGQFFSWTWEIRRAIRIVHSRNDIPQKLIFRARKTPTTEMLTSLGILGYTVP